MTILVGLAVLVQWAHLALRQRGNARMSLRHAPELQVFGLAAAFALAVALWSSGLAVASGALVRDGVGSAATTDLAAALVLALAGASLRIAAIERIGRGFSWGTMPPEKLITDGIYRFTKHPLVLGYVLEVGALALCGPRSDVFTMLLVFALTLVSLSAAAQIAKEERGLAARFPEAWEAYRRRTPF